MTMEYQSSPSESSAGGNFPTIASSSSLSSGYADCFTNSGGLPPVSKVTGEDGNFQGPVSLFPPLLLITNDIYNLST